MNHAQTEGIDLIFLERSGELRTEADLAQLPQHLSDPRSLIWCDITGIEGGQQGPYGQLLREVFGFLRRAHYRGLLHNESSSQGGHLRRLPLRGVLLLPPLGKEAARRDRRGGHVRREKLRGLHSFPALEGAGPGKAPVTLA